MLRAASGTFSTSLAGSRPIRCNAFFDVFYVTGWGLVGADGADRNWDVSLALGSKFTDTTSAVAGYRAVGMNYNKDGFVFDVVEQGPIIVSFHFKATVKRSAAIKPASRVNVETNLRRAL